MARPQSPPILAQLRSARTLPEQTAALRALKNEIVGHVQRKEFWVSLGVLDPIVRTLASSRPPVKPNGKDTRFPLTQRPLSEDESVRLQALQLVASFANGTVLYKLKFVVVVADGEEQVVQLSLLPSMPRGRSPPSWPTYLRLRTHRSLS